MKGECEAACMDMSTRARYWIRETEVSVAEIIGILEVVKLKLYEELLNENYSMDN